MKQILNFPNYCITADGKVYSKYRNKYLKPDISSGYKRVSLSKNGKLYRKFVHHLVLESFIEPRPKEKECRHLDGNSLNNNLFNLCWGTKKENGADDKKHGVKRGIKNAAAKLNEDDVHFIVYLYETGLFSHRQIAKYMGISKTNIGDILRKKIWKHLWKK